MSESGTARQTGARSQCAQAHTSSAVNSSNAVAACQ